MGIYLNPGNRGFWQAVRSKIYVDKSGLISYTNQLINTEEQFLCVSRPRRFGKSMALKMFWEYSMTDPFDLEEYTGFTKEEVETLCAQHHMDFSQVSNWYDGYRFRRFHHIYNPKSVAAAMISHVLSNYWTSTETYEALKIYIELDFDGLRQDMVRLLGGEHIGVNTLSFQNDMHTLKTKDDVLTLLIHLGYLAYNPEKKEVHWWLS